MDFLGKYSSMNHMGFYKKGNLEMINSWFMYKLFMENDFRGHMGLKPFLKVDFFKSSYKSALKMILRKHCEREFQKIN